MKSTFCTHRINNIDYHRNGYVSYENSVKATAEFTKAIKLDPEFARARAWIVCSMAGMW